MSALPEDFKAKLRQLLGPAGCIEDPDQLAPYLVDWRGKYHGSADLMACPKDSGEAAAVISLARQHGVAIIPQGGNTGLVGASLPGLGTRADLLVSCRRMRHMDAVDPHSQTITVGAGVTIQEVQQAAADAGLLFPLSLASEGSCTVGGAIATNAGGVHVIRYGSMRALTLGVETVLADGSVASALAPLVKDNRGPNLAALMAGSEGTLGLITRATLKLAAAERHHLTLWLGTDSLEDALALLGDMRGLGDGRLSVFEVMHRDTLALVTRHIDGTRLPIDDNCTWHCLIEFGLNKPSPELETRLAEYLENESRVLAGSLAQNDRQRRAFWRLRESLSEAQKLEGVSVKHDISLPLARIPDFVAETGALLTQKWPKTRLMVFGHLGDGNLHFNLMQPPGDAGALQMRDEWQAVQTLVHDAVARAGGSISAEHGIGRMKRDDLARLGNPGHLALLKALKTALDPDGLFNPDVLI